MKTQRELFEEWLLFNGKLTHKWSHNGKYSNTDSQLAWEALQAFKASVTDVNIPDGWVVVPKNPTEEMCDEGFKDFCCYKKDDFPYGAVKCMYYSMIEAVENKNES